MEYEGIKYNLIDAPGLFDFEAGEYEGIRAAESVLVVVSGRSGVTVGAEKAFQLARKNGKATMVFVSKCDLENANYFKILEDMKIKFGSTVCPCVVPAKLDDGSPRVHQPVQPEGLQVRGRQADPGGPAGHRPPFSGPDRGHERSHCRDRR